VSSGDEIIRSASRAYNYLPLSRYHRYPWVSWRLEKKNSFPCVALAYQGVPSRYRSTKYTSAVPAQASLGTAVEKSFWTVDPASSSPGGHAVPALQRSHDLGAAGQGREGRSQHLLWRCDRYCRWLDCSMPSYGLPGGALMLTLSSAGERLSVLTGATGDVGLCSALGDAYAIPRKDQALGPRYRAVPPPQFVGTSLCASEPLYIHVQNRRA
jgi:hypothetical protein